MSGSDRNTDDDFALSKVLSRRGFPFQYAVLTRCMQSRGGWRHVVSEYPVSLRGVTTHVDFVLESHEGTYIVAECKRVYGWRWGFARGLERSRSNWGRNARGDLLLRRQQDRQVFRHVVAFPTPRPFDVAVEMKNHEKKPEVDAPPRQLDGAVTQALRAAGGFMHDLASRPQFEAAAVLPVIFTSAPLVTTNTELGPATNLQSGNLEKVTAESPTWLRYDHNVSEPLRPQVPLVEVEQSAFRDPTAVIQASLDRDATRSIAIVSVDGIEEFLQVVPQLLHRPHKIQ